MDNHDHNAETECPCQWTDYETLLAFRGIRNKNFKYEDYRRYYTLIYADADEKKDA